jgi:hypothetical protein
MFSRLLLFVILREHYTAEQSLKDQYNGSNASDTTATEESEESPVYRRQKLSGLAWKTATKNTVPAGDRESSSANNYRPNNNLKCRTPQNDSL